MKWVRTVAWVVVLILLACACDTELDDGAIPISPEYMDVNSPDWGPSGLIIFSSWNYGTYGSELWYCDSEGAGLKQVTDNYFTEFSPSWSPDGKSVVCGFEGDSLIEYGLFVCDISDGGLTPLITGDTYIYPKWSPDGSRIAYNRRSDYNLFVIDVESTIPEDLGSHGLLVGWAADSERLLCKRGKGDYLIICILDLGTGEETEAYVGTHSMTSTAISPNGEWAAYEYNDPNKHTDDIYIANLKTKEVRRVTYETDPDDFPGMQIGAFHPTWSPDGKWLAFSSTRSSRHLYKIRVF
jgi:Tol biopolymer transport system component